MTNYSEDEFSFTAKLILEAYQLASLDDGPTAAAVLRVAAYQVAPAVPSMNSCCERREAKIRHQLLAIADELEGVKYGTYRCTLPDK
jgi:hypothetical protein